MKEKLGGFYSCMICKKNYETYQKIVKHMMINHVFHQFGKLKGVDMQKD